MHFLYASSSAAAMTTSAQFCQTCAVSSASHRHDITYLPGTKSAGMTISSEIIPRVQSPSIRARGSARGNARVRACPCEVVRARERARRCDAVRGIIAVFSTHQHKYRPGGRRSGEMIRAPCTRFRRPPPLKNNPKGGGEESIQREQGRDQ